MVNPIIGKTSVRAVTSQESGRKTAEKTGPSKFDQVRVKLQDQQFVLQDKLPPQVTQVSGQEKRVLESDLRRRLEQTRAQTAGELFKGDLKKVRVGMEGLNRQVSSVPKSPVLDALRQRLNSIEVQFKETGKLAKGVSNLDNPRDLLKVQTQIYQLSENIEIMTKVVEQVNTGIKSILQTQV